MYIFMTYSSIFWCSIHWCAAPVPIDKRSEVKKRFKLAPQVYRTRTIILPRGAAGFTQCSKRKHIKTHLYSAKIKHISAYVITLHSGCVRFLENPWNSWKIKCVWKILESPGKCSERPGKSWKIKTVMFINTGRSLIHKILKIFLAPTALAIVR